mgnify:CR=1 FL=1
MSPKSSVPQAAKSDSQVLMSDRRLDIWTGTQIPLFVVTAAASMTGLRAEDIHLHNQISGGSFGPESERMLVLARAAARNSASSRI